jgi:hypothetical protein
MKESRDAGLSDNQTVLPGQAFYGRQVVRLMDDELNILLEEPFTGDLPRLDYLIDVAEEASVMVTVRQDVYAFNGAGGRLVDGGYEIQLFPLFALREGNEFVPFEHEHDEDDEHEPAQLDN